ncbi:MAG: glycogen debranching protein [Nitrospirales bacterium]|nr:MAG: glycogen debranching protein [Nitrospirales bacterium]
MFSHLSERVRLADRTLAKLSDEQPQTHDSYHDGIQYLSEFRLDMGLPVWRYTIDGTIIEKCIMMPHHHNTVIIMYRLLEGKPVRLKLMPSIHNRSHDAPVNTPLPGTFRLSEINSRYELSVSPDLPTLRMLVNGSNQAFTVLRQTIPEIMYPIEEYRGYEQVGTMWSPGYFRVDLSTSQSVSLVASTEPWDDITALQIDESLDIEHERRKRQLSIARSSVRTGIAGELALAADQFLIKPVGRTEDAARIRAEGHDICTVIAGYHWFTDWGRDTMISLEGLTLTTGRYADAANILRLFAHYIWDGLLPNLFPEGGKKGLYHTADATLWFFHAIDRYVEITHDLSMLNDLLPHLVKIAEHHLRGTHFGIGVDPQDQLLRQGKEGFQLTWMDAKVDDWVVTPRRGKAVEINALWYNALCLLAEWVRQIQGSTHAEPWETQAKRTRASFNSRFWSSRNGYLFDVVDGEEGDDLACRPNQLFAMSLKYPVLDQEYWKAVLQTVQQRLLTPIGLRSLSAEHPHYHEKYYGDIYARDASYHQGTVWAWLIGPFIDAWLKVYPDDLAGARQFLSGFEDHLNQACIGSISEIFDAESPFIPRGCVAQAWSVAEVLRTWEKTEPSDQNNPVSK